MISSSLVLLVSSWVAATGEEVSLFNGKDFEGWRLITRKSEAGLGEKVFSITKEEEIHVYRDFPDGYQLDEGKDETHAIMLTDRSFENYRFSWEYRWGAKKLNNFGKYQYDAGMFYHVQKGKVWPQGFEYQIRYDHRSEKNHTGDVWNCGVGFEWSKGPKNSWLSEEEGGRPTPHGGGEHLAKADARFHALDGEWNQCEVIVMGKDFAIHKLNGEVVNVITRLAFSSGPIAMQAETAEIFYRNMRIEEFEKPRSMDEFLVQKD
ncbi:DUF1080 domain-containing protein [Roseibacillus persicicus]|uniref:3-keto-disaccharide hydrolase n=1 Tax=Roseibacillus persicicus TaxID=454148 RepID=UPI00398A6892